MKKLSESHKNKIKLSNLGLKRSQLTKKRISDYQKGRKKSQNIKLNNKQI